MVIHMSVKYSVVKGCEAMTQNNRNKKIEKLMNTVTELGGTVYEVAEDAGLLSAGDFLKVHLGEEIIFHPEKVKIVTEVYVQFENSIELDRIFLYLPIVCERMIQVEKKLEQSDRLLADMGCIVNGRLVIAYERLKELADRGYRCLYHRSPDGHNGKSFVRYNNAFGENRTMLPFEMWDSSATFVGNGLNHALLVETAWGRVFVMPDIHTVKESIRVYHTENLIREKYDEDFRVERISLKDTKALETLKTVKQDIVGLGNMLEDDKLPESYWKLYYQIAYLMTYYPKEYAEIWGRKQHGIDKSVVRNTEAYGTKEYEEKTQEAGTVQEKSKVSIGICFKDYASYGVCRMPGGHLAKIPNLDLPYETPINLRYSFGGYGNIAKAEEMVIEKMAGVMKAVVSSAQLFYNVEVEKVYATVIVNITGHEEIVEVESINWERLLVEAAKQVGVPEPAYTDYLTAIMSAYRKKPAVCNMQENDVVLVYDFGQLELIQTLLKKTKDNDFVTLGMESLEFPMDVLYEEGEDCYEVYKNSFQDVYEDEDGELYNPGLREVLWSNIDEFMLDAGLRELGIRDRSKADCEAWKNIRMSYPTILRQLKRNNSAKIVFDNGYLKLTEDYPISKLEKCFLRIFKNHDALIEKLLKDSGIAMSDISVVLLAGSECEYPFVAEHIKEVTGAEICRVNALHAVGAMGVLE